MERVRRAIAVELECPPPELSTVEEPYRRIVEEVAVYVAERGKLEKEKYNELYRRFRKQYPLPAQLIQQAINQGVETGKSFLKLKRNGRVHKPPPPRFDTSPSALPKTAGATERRRPQPPQSKSPYPSPVGGEKSG
ncbi:MAG: hypothetical protein ACO2PM_23530 [Pyrobaculum sp.]